MNALIFLLQPKVTIMDSKKGLDSGITKTWDQSLILPWFSVFKIRKSKSTFTGLFGDMGVDICV